MQLHLIRNATLRLTYGGCRWLIDPFLAPKHTLRSFAGISPNPLVDLPCTPQEVVAGIDRVIVSHLHPDHFDTTAEELLPKSLPLFCQPGDESQIASKGFHNVTPVENAIERQGIRITRTLGQHGTGAMAERMGKVSGFLFQARGEPTVYWAGDTIWYQAVAQVITGTQPDVIITHSSGAKIGEYDPIVMDAGQTIAVCRAAPRAVVVAVHMEALDHGTVSRADLRGAADAAGIGRDRLLIPDDGVILTL
jgi:L-ascorbate metabolism protein UlaG (beta-lactamase superfamily)